jgi:hypothetical protein
MERKTETKIKGLIKEERNAHFIFSDDLFIEADAIKENEDYLAQKFLTIIGSNKEDEEEIMIKIRPDQLYNFFVRIQREILIGK